MLLAVLLQPVKSTVIESAAHALLALYHQLMRSRLLDLFSLDEISAPRSKLPPATPHIPYSILVPFGRRSTSGSIRDRSE